MNHLEKYNFLVKLAEVTSNIKRHPKVDAPLVDVNSPVHGVTMDQIQTKQVPPMSRRPAAPQAGDDSPINTGDDSPIHGGTRGFTPPMSPRPAAVPAVLPGKPVPTTSTSRATSPVTAVQSSPINQPITDSASLDPVNKAPAVTAPPPRGNLLGLPTHQFDTISQAYQRQGRGDFGALSAKRQKTMYDRFRNFYSRGN